MENKAEVSGMVVREPIKQVVCGKNAYVFYLTTRNPQAYERDVEICCVVYEESWKMFMHSIKPHLLVKVRGHITNLYGDANTVGIVATDIKAEIPY